ncbi:MAG: uracil-DNA glycosylase [Mariprofundus sp.]|nr:uracil-DNA glycosylase [Mariprofundus sp.]
MDKQMTIMAPSWDKQLASEFNKAYMHQLQAFLNRQDDTTSYPPAAQRYEAFRQTPFEKVKVIILGQDPYHAPGQAHGLSFSVPVGQPIPPSLRNIYKELQEDLGIKPASHGYLEYWAAQGVLLLNCSLSVTDGSPNSHQSQGWETFTDQVLITLARERQHLVFMLWGKTAQHKGAVFNHEGHLLLNAPHPSPLSAYRGFFGSHHFSQANKWLKEHKQEEIDWQLPELS